MYGMSSISQSRSLEEMTDSWDTHSLTDPPSVPADLVAEFVAMHLLSDQALQAAAQPSLSPAELYRLRQLNHAAGERSLAQAEEAEQTALLDAYHHSVLRRAQALAILAQRKHEIPYRTSLEIGADDDTFD